MSTFKRLQVLQLASATPIDSDTSVVAPEGTRVVVIREDNTQIKVRIADKGTLHGNHVTTTASNLLTRKRGRPASNITLSQAAISASTETN